MALKSQFTLLMFSTLLVVVTFVLTTDVYAMYDGGKSVLVGIWAPILDPNGPNVLPVAQFAINEHNKEAKVNLKFIKVISGQTMDVAGFIFDLVIAAIDGAVIGHYKATVWTKPWKDYMNLTSFRKL
ncbi:hypothetical protein HYC85_017632 [Camellia sinensis]|uniref:Cystatin domain-containing protein n=1 Tax=Camellia sinensis TaxID=4442 RepID=A0A7J7GTM3_CAMSI|nr:hypothetical protein HYC85_017632 [Camellia sinensis]